MFPIEVKELFRSLRRKIGTQITTDMGLANSRTVLIILTLTMTFLRGTPAFASSKPETNAVSHSCPAILEQIDQVWAQYNDQVADYQTVFYEGSRDGNIILSQKEGVAWTSVKPMVDGTLTLQGSAANPFLLFGKELSILFGMRMWSEQTSNGVKYFFQIPEVEKWETLIRNANKILVARGQEPLSYMPTEAGLLTAEEILKLSVKQKINGKKRKTDQYVLLRFPFADKDSQLVPHEVAYHLASILLSRQILESANRHNQMTVDFIKYMRSRKDEMGMYEVLVDDIIRDLIKLRAYELDVGTGNLVSILEGVRQNSEAKYSQVWKKLKRSKKKLSYLVDAVNMIARPSLTPLEALLLRLERSTGISFGDTQSIPLTEISTYIDDQVKSAYFPLRDKRRLEGIIHDFIALKSQAPNLQKGSAEEWTKAFILGLDKRIEQISSALRVLQGKEEGH